MDKIILQPEDIDFLFQWRDKHKDLVRMNIAPLKAVKIIFPDSHYTITAIRDGSKLKFSISQDGKSIGTLIFIIMSSGICVLHKDKTKLKQEDKQAVLTVYASAMAMLAFGKETVCLQTSYQQITGKYEEKKVSHDKTTKIGSTKKKHKGATYILSYHGNEPKMIIKGSHSSPSCTFSVRGHYRHYKSGKVIWIEEYEKGSGKRKDTVYKIKGRK